MRKAKVIPVAIGALEKKKKKHFEKWIQKLNLDLMIGSLFAWSNQNLMESVAYEIRKKMKLYYLRRLVGVHYCEITSDLTVKEIIIILIIIMIYLTYPC